MQLLITTAFKFRPPRGLRCSATRRSSGRACMAGRCSAYRPSSTILSGAAVIIGSSIVVILRELISPKAHSLASPRWALELGLSLVRISVPLVVPTLCPA